MLFDDGLVRTYSLRNRAEAGDMPKDRLELYKEFYFGERVVGYGRRYSAKSVNEQADKLIRIWHDRGIRAGMVAVIDGEQYRVDQVQALLDEDGQRVNDLTLSRLEDFYDVDEGEA